MRKRLVVLLLFSCTIANTQVYNGNLTLRSQAEIDDFSSFSYTSVNGFVRIEDGLDGEHDIRNLAGLAGLTSVTGNLTLINNNLLTNTAFLNVASVQKLQIANNPALTIINGLPLTSAHDGIDIINNAALSAVTAFNSLTEITEAVAIRDNPLLTNLGGFSNLQKARVVDLGRNNSLVNLNGFAKVSELSTLRLNELPALSNIDGLASLRIVGSLTISNCSSLTNINGLSNLATASFMVHISDNASLQNVDGLSGLTGNASIVITNCIGMQSINGSAGLAVSQLIIRDNPALKTISGFANANLAGLEITDNHALETLTGFNRVQRASLVLQNNLVLKTINIFPQLRSFSRFNWEGNYIAENISPMPLLDSVYSDFVITTDSMLRNLDFIPNLRFVSGSLSITANNNIENINGLSNLDSVGMDILLSLPDARNVDALSKIENVNGTLNLGLGAGFESLAGLRNLKKVGANLLVGGGIMTNLNDFVNLQSVDGVLLISGMQKLTNLDGLRNLRNADQVYVRFNPLLSGFCGLYGLFAETPPTGIVQIHDNQVNPTATDIRNGGPCSTLPVHLLDFNLKCADHKIILNWVTANEIDNSHFIVQRSSNGILWTDLDLIPAAGNNGGVTTYSFTDNQPPANAYYRLAQVDLDRKIHYSPVVRAACAAETKYSVRPNPASHRVLVSIRADYISAGMLKLADSKGSIIKSKNIMLFPGQNQIEINISGIPKGIYFLQLIYDRNKEQQRTILLKN